VANGENASGGFGLLEKDAMELLDAGIDVLTSGNHIWDKRAGVDLLETDLPILRPENYPAGNPGRGMMRIVAETGCALWVMNLQGRILMSPIDCPFRCADLLLERVPDSERCVLVDFHAEATSEKRAMGWHLDGRVSAVLGTHTHVQTSDEEILPGGTAYITDVGMTGPYESVIGMRKEDSLHRILKGTPRALNVARGGVAVAGVAIELDESTGKCLTMERLLLRESALEERSR